MYKIDIDWPWFFLALGGYPDLQTHPPCSSPPTLRWRWWSCTKRRIWRTTPRMWSSWRKPAQALCWKSHGNPMVSTWENQIKPEHAKHKWCNSPIQTGSCLEALEKTLLITIHGLGTRNVDQHQIWIFCAQTRLIQIQTRFYIVKLLRIVNTRLELDFPVEIRLGTRTTWEICCSLEINQRPVTLYVTR